MSDLFRKKPVVVEAMQLVAGNAKDVCDWVHGASRGTVEIGYDDQGRVHIATLEGTMRGDIGWWVIRGVKGEFYACEPQIFGETYEAVDVERDAERLYISSSLSRETSGWDSLTDTDRDHFRARIRASFPADGS